MKICKVIWNGKPVDCIPVKIGEIIQQGDIWNGGRNDGRDKDKSSGSLFAKYCLGKKALTHGFYRPVKNNNIKAKKRKTLWKIGYNAICQLPTYTLDEYKAKMIAKAVANVVRKRMIADGWKKGV